MKKLPWRGALYLVVISYLFLDLQVFHGPLRDAMRSRRDASVVTARENGWVALVNQEPITPAQLDLAVTRHLHQRGKSGAGIPDKNLVMIRRAVLQSLIDDTLIRQHADGDKFEVKAEEVTAFITSWKSGFSSPEELITRAEAQGLDPAALDAELTKIWKRKRWIEHRIGRGVTVTETEARDWYEANRLDGEGKNRPGFFEPEKLLLRRVLLAPGDEARARSLYEKLNAAEISLVDLAKTEGGESGWIPVAELPVELAWELPAVGPVSLIAPFQTPLGWQLVEVLERVAERPLPYEEVSAEIIAHLEAQRTEETVKELAEKLRKVANLQVFPENL